MRTAFILPLAMAAVGVAGCGSGPDDIALASHRVPERDLTLQQATSPELEFASPIELARSPVEPASTRRAPQTRTAKHTPHAVTVSTHPAAAPSPAPAPAASEAPTTSLAAADAGPPDPHALAPGQTVTVLPAAGGSSTAEPSGHGDWTDQLPPDRGTGTTIHGGRGGDCGGRGGGSPGGWTDGGGVLKGLR